MSAEISRQQEEKYRLEQQVAMLNEKLATLNRKSRPSNGVDSMQENVEVKNSYEKTIVETEAAYMKVLFAEYKGNRFWKARRRCCRCSSGRAPL